MKIDILTLFPEMFENVFSSSIIKRAIEEKKVEINIHNFRDYSKDSHHKVDDTPYGGGAGMVIRADVVYDAFKSLKSTNAKTIFLSPI